MGIVIIVQIINALLLIGGIVGLGLFIFILLKLNKALNIWLGQNKQ